MSESPDLTNVCKRFDNKKKKLLFFLFVQTPDLTLNPILYDKFIHKHGLGYNVNEVILK